MNLQRASCSTIAGLVVALWVLAPLRADFVVSVGNELLLPDTPNQIVSIYGIFVNTPANSDPNIGGLQLNVRLNDGAGIVGMSVVFQGAPNENSQSGIEFLGGTVWDGPEAVDIVGSAPVDLDLSTVNGPADVFPQYGSMGIGFVSNTNFRTLTAAPQLIAKLVIDTTGYNGPVDIILDDIILGESFFMSQDDVAMAGITTFVNRISSVPEPTSTVQLLIAAGCWIGARRRHGFTLRGGEGPPEPNTP